MENYLKMILGSIFLLISAILLSSQFISAAIISINKNNWSPGAIYNVIGSAGYILLTLSIIFFLVGLVIILLSWIKSRK